MSLSVNIRKDFGSFTLNAQFEAGNETLALLGASGCGKSMTLKCIAGIVTPDEGKIVLDGVTLFDSAAHINLPPQKRRVGLLFQNYALFPNMTVEQNLLAGIRRAGRGQEQTERLKQLLERFYLTDLERRRPEELSGGQQQRVALARILMSQPRILMLDEPFSALDAHLRWEVEQEVMRVIDSFGGTTLLVSHDRDQIYRIADKVAVYGEGTVEVTDEKWSLFRDPRTLNAARLTGCKNLSPAHRNKDGRVFVPAWGLTLEGRDDRPVTHVGIRAHDFQSAKISGENTFPFEVVRTIEDTFSFILMVRPRGAAEDCSLRWELSKEEFRALPKDGLLCIPKEKLLLLSDAK
ncbi:MAG: ATP-binding cassette domain-containing protein [Oscillospiraceae bacterium]|nr:ATP-binding cassette domain-containing protein [Oscillospiraceae bacterium]